MYSSLVFFLLTLLAVLVCHAQVQEDAEDEQKWIDPHDMLNYVSSETEKPPKLKPEPIPPETTHSEETSHHVTLASLQSKLAKCKDKNKSLKSTNQHYMDTCSKPCDTPYFKRLARKLLQNVETSGNHKISLELNPYEVEILKQFVDSEEGNVHDVSEVILKVFSVIEDENARFAATYLNMLSPYLNEHTIVIAICIVAITGLVFILQKPIQLSWRRHFFFIVGVCIIVSIPWEWYHLYRIAFAKKQMDMMNDMPKQCRPDHVLGPIESLSLWWKNSFTFSDDPCVKYQESLLVDPLWEVSPVKALSVTITMFFIQPLESIAEASGKSFHALFKGVPIQWQPFVFLAVMIFIILLLFLLTGVQVRLPFVTIGTGNIAALPVNVNNQLERLQQQVQGLDGVVRGIVPAIQQDNDDRGAPPVGVVREGNVLAIQQRRGNVEEQQNAMDQKLEQLLQLMEAVEERLGRQEEHLQQIQEAIGKKAPEACENDWVMMGNANNREERHPVDERRPHQNTEPPSVEDVTACT